MIQRILDKRRETMTRIEHKMGLPRLILLIDAITEIEVVKDPDFQVNLQANGTIGTIHGCSVIVVPNAVELCEVVVKL